jgi:Putative Actinobacterial Holin-X, holin superfamily III
MLAPSSDLLRAGLGLKVNQIKLATRSYLRDRANQATGTVTSYAVAAGLFAAAGIFLIAACLVGITALFRWVEIEYGLFPAFGVVGALLLAIAGVCAAVAIKKMKQPSPHFPSLTSRLRVAVAGRADPEKVDALLSPSASRPRLDRGRPRTQSGAAWNSSTTRTGLILGATLLGWAATRRRQARRM